MNVTRKNDSQVLIIVSAIVPAIPGER